MKLNFEGAGVKAHKLFARNFGQVSTLGNHSLVTTLTVDPAVATTAVLNCMPSTIPVNGSTVRGDWSVRNGRAVDRGKTVQILDETKVVATTTPLTAGTSMGNWKATANGLSGCVRSLTARYAGKVSTQPSVLTVSRSPRSHRLSLV